MNAYELMLSESQEECFYLKSDGFNKVTNIFDKCNKMRNYW